MKKILFVCTGNTCRSPMAEGLFRQLLIENRIEDMEAASAGTAAFAGDPASDHAVLAMAELGIDLSGHRSKRVTEYTLEEAGTVYVMTPYHAEYLRMLAPEAGDKIHVLGSGVPDPFGGSLDDYRQCRDVLRERLAEILKNLHEES